jgi:hypothetical protein
VNRAEDITLVNGRHVVISICLLAAAGFLLALSTLVDAPWWKALCWIPAFFAAFAGVVEFVAVGVPFVGFLLIMGTIPALGIGFIVYVILCAAGVIHHP